MSVRVNVTTYTTTYVAANMLRSLKQIIAGCGLDITKILNEMKVLEDGVSTWLGSRHLKALVLEVLNPANPAKLIGRFDFTIDYGYYADGDGDLWLDPDTVAWEIRKAGAYPSRCSYRIVADTANGAPTVAGWQDTELRSTGYLARHSAGTAIGGGSIGVALSHWK